MHVEIGSDGTRIGMDNTGGIVMDSTSGIGADSMSAIGMDSTNGIGIGMGSARTHSPDLCADLCRILGASGGLCCMGRLRCSPERGWLSEKWAGSGRSWLRF